MSDVHALKLSHFSSKRVEEIKAREQKRKSWWPKPTGLWLSVDGEDDWEAWCVAESFGTERLAIRHRVALAPDANVLLLSTSSAVFDFSRQYGWPSLPEHRDSMDNIDWAGVSAKHDGIIIAPYQFDCRLADGANWYYGWDCASGCVWHPRAVASIEVVTDLLREAA